MPAVGAQVAGLVAELMTELVAGLVAVYEIGLLLGVLMNQAEVGFMLQMLPADTEYKQIWLV